MKKNNKIIFLSIIILIFHMLLPRQIEALSGNSKLTINLPSELVKSDIAIWKLPNEDEKILFEKLKDKNDIAITEEYGDYLQKISPNKKEKVVFENLEEGTYYVKQLDSEEKGKRLVPLVFKITSPTDQVTITGKSSESEQPKVSFRFVKIDKDTKERLRGATFELLLSKDGKLIPIRSDLVSDEKGGFEVRDIDVGSYYLREIQAPDGYKRLEYNLVLTAGENIEKNYLEIENEKLPKIDIPKIDMPNTGDIALILALVFGTSIFILGFLMVKRDNKK